MTVSTWSLQRRRGRFAAGIERVTIAIQPRRFDRRGGEPVRDTDSGERDTSAALPSIWSKVGLLAAGESKTADVEGHGR